LKILLTFLFFFFSILFFLNEKGPGLLAFALFCGALSLRMWRRNGIACDELLFLPGTPLEDERQRHGTCYQEMIKLFPCLQLLFHNDNNMNNNSYNPLLQVVSEEEGGSEEEGLSNYETSSTTTTLSPMTRPQHVTDNYDGNNNNDDDMQRLVYTLSSQQVHDDKIDDNLNPNIAAITTSSATTSTDITIPSWNEGHATSLFLVRNFFLCRLRQRRRTQQQQDATTSAVPTITTPEETSTAMDPNFTYSPSGASVLGAALDLALPVLLNFHLFIAAFSHPRYAGSQTPKIFPCKLQYNTCLLC
jgi:hypothetical protein